MFQRELLLGILLLPAVFGVIPIARRVQNCLPGDVWVENYIKYQCYLEENVKGARIIGCVPSNDNTGIVLEAWETYNAQWFKYICEIIDNSATYKIKTCLDPTRGILPVGKTRSFPDGRTFSCITQNNDIRLQLETNKGCAVGTTVYAEGASWIDRREDYITIDGEKKIVGQGTTYVCHKASNGSYTAEFAACLTADNTYIRPNSFGLVDEEVVKCDTANGDCKLREARSTEIRCLVNGKMMRHDEEWTSSDGKTAYVCQFGSVVKKGCLVQGVLVPLYSVKYVGNNAFYCNTNNEILDFGDLKGCKDANGELIQFDSQIRHGDRIDKCGFNFGPNGSIIFTWTQVGCAYQKEELTANAIQQIDGKYIHCVKNGTTGFIVKIMTKEEIEHWMKQTGQKFTTILDGVEGEGQSHSKQLPTTTTTTTTTPAPTTTTTTTTTTSAPTTTTTPKTTTTTTTPAPIIKTTPKTTKCVDLYEKCGELAVFCHSDEELFEDLKDALSHSTVSQTRKKRALEYLNLISNENGPKPTEPTKNHGSCQECNASKHQGTHGPKCPCQEQKDFVRKIVRNICPKTCNSCDEKSTSISQILTAAVSNKCHKRDCPRIFH